VELSIQYAFHDHKYARERLEFGFHDCLLTIQSFSESRPLKSPIVLVVSYDAQLSIVAPRLLFFAPSLQPFVVPSAFECEFFDLAPLAGL
jgi:hypothetical protein